MLPYYKIGNTKRKLTVVRGVTVLFCGHCEGDFLAKLKEGQDNPSYQCPKCKCSNKYEIIWK